MNDTNITLKQRRAGDLTPRPPLQLRGEGGRDPHDTKASGRLAAVLATFETIDGGLGEIADPPAADDVDPFAGLTGDVDEVES